MIVDVGSERALGSSRRRLRAIRASVAITLAKFGHGEAGTVGRRVVAAPDGSAVFAAGARGIVRIETADLTVSARALEGIAVDAIAVTPDGSTLYALSVTAAGSPRSTRPPASCWAGPPGRATTGWSASCRE